MTFKIVAPCSGHIIPLEQISDAVFSSRVLGDGIGINPSTGIIYAPFDGTVTTLHNSLHALTIKNGNVEVLIHIGIDTVDLNGEGFTAHTSSGKEVKKGEILLAFDMSAIEEKGFDKTVVVLVLQPENIPLQKTNEAFVYEKESSLLSIETGKSNQNSESEIPAGNTFSFHKTVTIQSENGLHARPAGMFAKAASKFEENIEIEKNGICVNAKSITGILSLNVQHGDAVMLRAFGPNAEQTVEAIIAEIKDELGHVAHQENYDFSKENTKITGIGINSGMVLGKAYWLKSEQFESTSGYRGFEEEIRTLQTAMGKATEELEKEINAATNNSYKEILKTHIRILEDPFLTETAESIIRNEKNAAYAFSEVIAQCISSIKKTGNNLIEERADDYKDIERRVLYVLSGKTTDASLIPEKSIIFAEELMPGDVAILANKVQGIISMKGSPTSHASIMLKNAGIPAIINATNCLSEDISNREVFLNAAEGYAVINPADEVKTDMLQAIEKAQKIHASHKRNAHEKALTKDGIAIKITGNIGRTEEAISAIENGAEGIGLVRTEFLFIHKTTAPTEDEQISCYQKILKNAGNEPITFRLFDISDDKQLSFFNIPKGSGSGFRGVRAYPANEAIIRTQIRALLRADLHGNVRLLIPMVSEISEIEYVRKLVKEEKVHINCQTDIPVGMMIEIPSAVFMMKQFAPHIDFFSVGTNDLTQYASATDRVDLCDENKQLNPGLLNLIRIIGETATCMNKPICVCGAMAGEFSAIPFLIVFGINELVCPGHSIPAIKAFIRELNIEHCKNTTNQALELSDAEEIKLFLEQNLVTQPQEKTTEGLG